jgi:regulator of sirC expression with transglutaminase-like and TPR domain
MEFENWQVSNTMRELVRQENVKHELSLLAAQQEKVREFKLLIYTDLLFYHQDSSVSIYHFLSASAKRDRRSEF